jgi:hypothetical protein
LSNCNSFAQKITPSALIERANVVDANYWANATVLDEPPVVEITLVSVTLQYESTTIDSESQLAQLVNADRTYLCDVPVLRMTLCSDGGKFDEKTFPLPKDTKLVYCVWIHEDQFIENTVLRKHLSGRLRFPPNLTSVDLSIPGREGLLSAGGIQNLGINTGYNSASLRSYHRKLVQDNLYDKDFESFMPNQSPAPNLGYDQSLVVNLKDYDILDGTQMKVVMRYNDTLSQPRWHLQLFCLVQKQLECTKQNIWTWKDA